MGFSGLILQGLSVEWLSSAPFPLHKACMIALLALVSMSVLEHSSVQRFVKSCFGAIKRVLRKNS